MILNTLTATESTQRYAGVIREFYAHFGQGGAVIIVSAPGRVEIIGNHTDHQNGCVLAAAADLDIICAAAANNTDTVRLISKGYKPVDVNLANLSPVPKEADTPAAMVRGVAAWFDSNGYKTPGFNAYMESAIPPGKGLSSSAAFEIAIGNCFAAIQGIGISPVNIAKAGMYAENHYMNKPSGLMDQIACSIGGLVFTDFFDRENPVIRKQALDLKKFELNICITDTGGSHAILTDEYARVVNEMRAAADVFGKIHLRDVDVNDFYAGINRVREKAGDRALLRAVHFFEENKRVTEAVRAAEEEDINRFLDTVRLSGQSSLAYLQNIVVPGNHQNQGVAVALMLSERILKWRGAWRVHGGGFAGTVIAFVPNEALREYIKTMEGTFGKGAVNIIAIRGAGGCAYDSKNIIPIPIPAV